MNKKEEPVVAGSRESFNYKAIVPNFSNSAIGFEQQNDVKSTSAGLGGSPREPYLTNTDNSPSTPVSVNDPSTSVNDELDFTENSMKMYVDTMNLYRTNKNFLQSQHLHGFQKLKYVNDDNLILYRPSNPGGNSNAGWKLAAENSNTDKARLASKQKALEKALANVDVWAYFATFTLDGTKQDRYNFALSYSHLAKFVQRRHIEYMIVPERHKDGAWHFHALLSAEIAPDLADFEGKALRNDRIRHSISKGEHPQHCRAYTERFGYNFVVPIRNKEACCLYMTKYVLKTFDDPNFERVSRRRFFTSTGLKEPYVTLPRYVDLDDYRLTHVSKHTEKAYLKRFDYTHTTNTPPPAFTPPPIYSLKG